MIEYEKDNKTGNNALWRGKLTNGYKKWRKLKYGIESENIPFVNTDILKITSGYHGTYSDFLMLPNDEWN
ncbi:MAG: hypothetical protein EU548_07370, partial [Promethearchaeota archaeon]